MKQKIQAFIDAILAQQRNNIFLWAPFCFAVGIAVYFGLKFEPPLMLGGITAGACIAFVALLFRKRDDSPIMRLLFLFSIAIGITSAGFCVAQWHSNMSYTPMLLKKKSPVGVIGTIESIEPLGEKDGSRLILHDVEIERLTAEETPRKIRLKVRQDDDLQAGQRISVLAGLNPASPPVAPNAFDFQRLSYFKGIGAVGFAYTAPEIIHGDLMTREPWLSVIRSRIINNIEKTSQTPQKAIIIALMTGQRGAIEPQDWDALRQSGLAHLLAISGLHVGMVAGVLFFFSRSFMAGFANFALHHPIKKYAAGIALVGALFYTLIVGATIPTQRALMMTGLVMVAIIFDRSPFSMRLVALAAIIVLFFSPESLTSVSFQMSFAAVVALIYFYDLIRPYWVGMHRQAGILRKFALYFVGVSLTTIVAGAATGLFSLYHFQNYAAYGVLANLFAVPLMGFLIMPFIVLSYVLMPLGLSALPLALIEWGVGWVLATAHWVADLEGAVWHVASFPHWIFIVMVCCAWFWIAWRGRLKLITIPIFVLMLGLIFIYKQADILISSKVDLVALRQDDGTLSLSTRSKERYTADQWMRLSGLAAQEKQKWPKEGSSDGFPFTCDSYGCRGNMHGQKISVSFTQKAWQEDCRWADVIISKTPVPYKECDAEYVIDFFDVWREGAHAVWLTPHKVKIKTVEQQRGKRLWTQTSANKKLSGKSASN